MGVLGGGGEVAVGELAGKVQLQGVDPAPGLLGGQFGDDGIAAGGGQRSIFRDA